MEEHILVTGCNGQLGHDVIDELKNRGIICAGVDIDDFDMTNAVQTDAFIRRAQPSAVIHCAAYTAVDKAESEPDVCRKVNAEGTKNIAEVCAYLKAKLVYISTDYVFPGNGETPFGVHDKTGPLNVYGKTKLAGEKAALSINPKTFIIRTSWVYGINGGNFVKTMIRLGKSHDEIRVVNDQIGSPTYTRDLARLICDMVETEKYGVYHATNEGYCSWAEFARAILNEADVPRCRIIPVTTKEYGLSAAKRPFNSRLSKINLDFASFKRLPNWRDALGRYIVELATAGELN